MMAEYIEREAVKKRMQAHYNFYLRAYGGFNNMPRDIKARVDELMNCIAEVVNSPAADVVEVVHGRWEAYPSDAFMRCSVCKREYPRIRMPQVVGWCPNPNCGARMDGE